MHVADTDNRYPIAAGTAFVMALATLLLLAVLHLVSPELDPSWRMVSEYANGRHGLILSLFFTCWAVSSWSLAYALLPYAGSTLVKAGIAFLVVAGIGEVMAAVFDINHPLHMLSAILGMNGLPIAALLIGFGLARLGYWRGDRRLMIGLSTLPLLGVVLMSAAMAHMFTVLSRAGVTLSADSKPLEALPPGVVLFSGWANRLLIVSFCAWAIVVSWRIARLSQERASA